MLQPPSELFQYGTAHKQKWVKGSEFIGILAIGTGGNKNSTMGNLLTPMAMHPIAQYWCTYCQWCQWQSPNVIQITKMASLN
jgi:hypothetical protein